MDMRKLAERREKVAAERVMIENKVKEQQDAIAEANRRINELIALLNLNAGILSEIDFQLKDGVDGVDKKEND